MSSTSSSAYLSSATIPNTPAAAAGVGLGYGIAIAVGILVLISTIMLASYVCVRVKGGPRAPPPAFHISTNTQPPSSPTAITVGLDEPTIESYPKFVYGVGKGDPQPATSTAGPCPICLSEYRRGDVLRSMLECGHCFHAACVDEWLRLSGTCPLCRSSPVPSPAATPLATPLSELIPLAVHAR